MNADQLVQYCTQALYVLIFVVAAIKASLRPLRSNIDIAIWFGVVTLIVAETRVIDALGIHSGRVLTAVTSVLLMALPYLLLRLADDFVEVPRPVLRAAALGLVLSAVCLFVFTAPYPLALTLAYVIYFVGFTLYDALALAHGARDSEGVTRRRLRAAALGTVCLSLVILWAGVEAAVPDGAGWSALGDVLALASGICYFIGFATPRWLRRMWQEPAVRTFLQRAAALARLPELAELVSELERDLARSFGTRRATIGLWDEGTRTLRYDTGETVLAFPDDQLIAGRAFRERRPIFSEDAMRDDPAHADVYARSGAHAVLAAPLTAGDRRFGVLAVYASRTPIFADDDLELAALLAGQSATILENHLLISEAAAVRAHAEATQLKDEFLVAAAHDLKTPLTALVAQAQLLERRARRNPSAPADPEGIARIVRETQRLKRLVLELLDVTRIQQGRLVTRRDPVDLAALLREACERQATTLHRCVLDGPATLIGSVDEQRMAQLIDNLLENAVKYSPDGGAIRVVLWRDADTAHFTVTDQGVGIPAGDLPHLFDRFHRGSNVAENPAPGLGLGLYICRGIVEQHGGTLSATSAGTGQGSTFHVTLPLSVPADQAAESAAGDHAARTMPAGDAWGSAASRGPEHPRPADGAVAATGDAV